MIIGGIQKNSFIDFPGKISCVVFLYGCNFRCPYCHNASLVRPDLEYRNRIELNTFLDFISKRRGFLDGIVISGGEPTLASQELITLCKMIKQIGYPIKLDTNGSKPRVLTQLLEKHLVDYIAMDIKTLPELYSKLSITPCDESRNILASIKLIMNSGIAYEFRTTCVKPMIDASILNSIVHLIKGADLYVLQHFVQENILCPEFFSGIKAGYDETALHRFQELAKPWVKRCDVR